MKRLISFCGLVLLVVMLMGATSLAFADESGDSGSAKREALDNASLLLGFMMSNPDYGIDYGIERIDAGSLVFIRGCSCLC